MGGEEEVGEEQGAMAAASSFPGRIGSGGVPTSPITPSPPLEMDAGGTGAIHLQQMKKQREIRERQRKENEEARGRREEEEEENGGLLL